MHGDRILSKTSVMRDNTIAAQAPCVHPVSCTMLCAVYLSVRSSVCSPADTSTANAMFNLSSDPSPSPSMGTSGRSCATSKEDLDSARNSSSELCRRMWSSCLPSWHSCTTNLKCGPLLCAHKGNHGKSTGVLTSRLVQITHALARTLANAQIHRCMDRGTATDTDTDTDIQA